MSNLNTIKSLYKPYRITINKGATIIESTTGKYVMKKKSKDLYTLFNYLESRGFNEFPKLVNTLSEDEIFEYLDDNFLVKEQKLEELSNVLASLHNKTVYFKSVSEDQIINVKESIENNINYTKNTIEAMFLTYLKKEYPSPSEYLFLRNYSNMLSTLNFAEKSINSWYEKVKETKKVRLSIVHNNLEMDHFKISSSREGLISWENFMIDSPVFDFEHLYKNEYLNYDFSEFIKNYFETFEFLEEEKDLLFSMLSLFEIPKEGKNEFENTFNTKNIIYYLYTTSNLIKPYLT